MDMGPSINTEYFSATSELEPTKLLAKMDGNADQDITTILDEFLGKIHDEASSHAVAEVVVDLRSVEFMSSACLKAFVTWIHVARMLPAPNRYQIVFLSQPEILWQRRSMHALSCVATDLVRLQA
jgi:hypothetical protein